MERTELNVFLKHNFKILSLAYYFGNSVQNDINYYLIFKITK